MIVGSAAALEAVRQALEAVLEGFGIDGELSVRLDEEGTVRADIATADAGPLIGKGGATIDAIQFVAAQIVGQSGDGERRRVVLDVAGYRERRAATLRELAQRAAEEAVRYGDEIELDAMSPQDRRVIHLELKERSDVVTRSEGDEPRRRVIVEPADGAEAVAE